MRASRAFACLTLQIGFLVAAPLVALAAPPIVEAPSWAELRKHPQPTRPPPEDAVNAVKHFRIHSIPFWTFRFSYQGVVYGPEYIVGHSIFSKGGGTSMITAAIAPVKFRLPWFIDPSTGKPFEADPSQDVAPLLNSPNFVASPFSTGFTQYQDAAQRASFYGYYAPDWHTLLTSRVLPMITIDVPQDKAALLGTPGTDTLVLAFDENWFADVQVQVNSALRIPADQLAVLLTHNTALYYNGDPVNGCCSLSWHGLYLTGVHNGTYDVQTHIWASWFTPDVIGDDFADVYAFSHELAEWANDPFELNTVPRWDFPQGPNFYYPPGACAYAPFGTAGDQFDLIEVADPLELSSYSYPVTLQGYTYHLAEQATASWFTRDVPSSAIDGAYSFPDETALTGPSLQCPY